MSSSRRLVGLLVVAFLILLPHSPESSAEAKGSQPGGAPATGAPSGMSMGQWKEASRAAQVAIEAPRGNERIAALEGFVKQYPYYPHMRVVLANLVEAYLDKGRFDPAHVASLLERQANTEDLYDFGGEELIVSRYYFKHHLPMESAERLLKKARAEIAGAQARLAKETSSPKRDLEMQSLSIRTFLLEVCEGRVLVEKKDYPGALQKLLEAQAAGDLAGRSGILLQDNNGKTLRRLPTEGLNIDWLNLSLATAYLKTGNRTEARASLGRVQDFLPALFPEIGQTREALQQELGIPRNAPGQEFRAEPKPALDFRFKDLEGKDVALSDYRDRVVLAMFWTTW